MADVMERERNVWDKTFYHRVIQSKIGDALDSVRPCITAATPQTAHPSDAAQ